MKALEIIAYKTSDGKIFECKRKADDHQENIVGELLDGFLPNDDRGNVTRSDRFNILTKQMKDPELLKKISDLYAAISHGVNN